jgi:hypothetical protein
VAYVGVASGDSLPFFHLLAAAFLGTGARVELVRLARKTQSARRAASLLEDADVVFLSGGDVDLGMRTLAERGVDDLLRRLARAGKPFIGVSAGSIMAGRGWVRFPDDDEARAEPFDCLGLAPLYLDAHSEDDGWSELRVLLRLLGSGVAYGVPSAGCLIVEASGDRAQLTARGAAIAQFGISRGKVAERPPMEAHL